MTIDKITKLNSVQQSIFQKYWTGCTDEHGSIIWNTWSNDEDEQLSINFIFAQSENFTLYLDVNPQGKIRYSMECNGDCFLWSNEDYPPNNITCRFDSVEDAIADLKLKLSQRQKELVEFQEKLC